MEGECRGGEGCGSGMKPSGAQDLTMFAVSLQLLAKIACLLL